MNRLRFGWRKLWLCLLLPLLLLLGADAGSKADPLVTQGWVDQYVAKQVADVDKRLDVLADRLNNFLVVRLWLGRDYLEQNGQKKQLDAPPYAASGRTYVPLRALGEAIGADFAWEGSTKQVTCTRGSQTIVLQVGSTKMTVDGVAQQIDAPPQVLNGRVCVPLRVISENLGFAVVWHSADKMIELTY